MKNISWFVPVVAIAGLMVGCAPQQPEGDATVTGRVQQTPGEGEERRAVAMLEGRSGSKMTGTATFTEANGQVTLVVEVQGVEGDQKLRAIHIHEFGDCSDPEGESAGGHWNPLDQAHGRLSHTEEAHLGDIGNIEIDETGRGSLQFTTDKWTIGTGANNDIVGKSLIVHIGSDDFETQPTGGAGDRIGCGVIQMTGATQGTPP
jgi:superoxide dismutase, Cu-Zn family